MKKTLAILLATSSVVAFADTFQDFNNNLYAQYSLTKYTTMSHTNGFGVGGTLQTKNNIWVNTNFVQNNDYSTGINTGNTFGLKAGYAFQFFGDDDNGFQVVPYASFGYAGGGNTAGGNSIDAYKWGVGVQPEYRFLSAFKASLGMGLAGYNGTNNNNASTTAFGFNVNPEIQYNIAKTVMVAVGYNFGTQFNDQVSANTNTVNAKVGYLF